MSTYLNFFIRKNDTFIDVFSYSKNSVIFDLFKEYCPYAKVKKITGPVLMAISNDITEAFFDIKEQKSYYQKRTADINAMSGTIKEKIEAIEDIEEVLAQVMESEASYQKAEGFISVLLNLEDTLKYSDDNTPETDGIYAGVEVEDPITVQEN